jgi:vitamin K-dependent gamma-carboxylase
MMVLLRKNLFRPVDGASLAAFRMGFGLLGLGYVARLLHRGWISRHWIEPVYHFHYPGFDWVSPWPGDGLYLHVGVMAVCAACVAAGLFHRVAAFVFALGFTHLFLLEAAEFENHYYLFLLLCWIMVIAPAHRVWSVDAWRRGGAAGEFVPAWAVYLLRAQWAVVFLFGALSKLNGDWLRGWPLMMWRPDAPRIALLGPFFDEPWMALLWSYTGIFFDLSIVPLLLYRPTRDFAFVALCMFFGIAFLVLGVGFFAAMGVVSATLFYGPSWPRKLLGLAPARDPAAVVPGASRLQSLGSVLILSYLLLQLLLPMRHWLYAGDASWTEEAHYFAWRMMLRDKRAEVRFRVTNPVTGDTTEPDPRQWLTERQLWRMARRPELIHQFARYLSDAYRDAEVRVESSVSLNGRRHQAMVDPTVDLAAEPYRWFSAAPWILENREPLRARSVVLAELRDPSYPPW